MIPVRQPSLNNAGDITFGGACEDSEGNGHDGIFLFSGGQLSTVVQSGDPSPIGGELALGFLPPSDSVINNNNEVLFQAWAFYGPFINNICGLMLCVDGTVMITNDTVIEVNGVPLGELSYPTEFQENGGTTTRVMSRDSQIEQIMPSGRPVQVTVFNSLTNLRSAPFGLVR